MSLKVGCELVTATHDLLLVVDVQNGFVNEKSQAVVEPLRQFVTGWVSLDRPVVFTRFINPPGSQWERLLHWTRLRDAPETDLHSSIAEIARRGEQSLIIDKCSYTSLNEEMLQVIAKWQPDRLLICGIATDGCVLKSAVDAFELGLTPIVLADLCASHAGEEVHQAGLLLLRRFIGHEQVILSSSL